MSGHAKRHVPWRMAVGRFFRTPKGLLLIVLALLVAIALPTEGFALVLPGLTSSVLLAGIADVLILRWRNGRWEFPSGAVLTALIVVMVLSPHQPWHIAAVTTLVAIVSKYIFRTRSANVFNPAALALVATFYVFDTGQDWWGALPELSPFAIAALLVAGAFITDRVNKTPLVLSFLGVYYFLFTVMAFAGNPVHVVEIYRAPDLHAVLFFAFFILTDPPTSPVKYRPQIICGVLVAVVSFVVFEWIGAVYYLLAGVLVGNAWEAWRRIQMHRRRPARAAVPGHARPANSRVSV
jgi:Na+-translocating ferredoxin:NAD+ oxidoreductase RnfD subunit